MIALIVLMVIDFLSGLILAIVFKKSKKTASGRLSSEWAFNIAVQFYI